MAQPTQGKYKRTSNYSINGTQQKGRFFHADKSQVQFLPFHRSSCTHGREREDTQNNCAEIRG